MAGDGTSFMVDLGALQDAIGSVSTERDTINEGITRMRATFAQVEEKWQGPAGSSFVSLAATFNPAADKLTALLEEAVGKMQAAHDNYAATEQVNGTNYEVKVDSRGTPDPGSSAQQDPSQQGPGTQPLAAPTARNQPMMANNAAAEPTARLG